MSEAQRAEVQASLRALQRQLVPVQQTCRDALHALPAERTTRLRTFLQFLLDDLNRMDDRITAMLEMEARATPPSD